MIFLSSIGARDFREAVDIERHRTTASFVRAAGQCELLALLLRSRHRGDYDSAMVRDGKVVEAEEIALAPTKPELPPNCRFICRVCAARRLCVQRGLAGYTRGLHATECRFFTLHRAVEIVFRAPVVQKIAGTCARRRS
jgi:hypothetical protein